ncbi:unnamed protein product [Cyclocybe aegerita]|uniref:DUF202 domain-containing protein n=1 Tax=Cyclocybe aegerita TaxID=1973307 RepID=A0A8S0WTY7_CYCAE|nr:unnamed protein product [Cyclocybe aegerita]
MGSGVEHHRANPAAGYPAVSPQEVARYPTSRRSMEPEEDIISTPRDARSSSVKQHNGHQEASDEQRERTSTYRPAPSIPAPAISMKRKFIPAGIPAIERSMLFDNPDNVGREHMASERTFLAYMRTGLAIVSAGVIFVQLFAVSNAILLDQDMPPAFTAREIERFARPLGLALIALGFSVVVIGLYRYLSVQSALQVQKYPVARVTTAFISFVLGGVTAVLFGVMLRGNRGE